MTTRQAILVAGLLPIVGCARSETETSAPLPPGVPLIAPGPTTPTGTVAERVAKAREQASAGELVAAIETLEEGLRIDLKDRESLRLLVEYGRLRSQQVKPDNTPEYYSRIVSAAVYLRRLREHYSELTEEERSLAIALFRDEAAVMAKSGRTDEALAALRDAAALGFRDADAIRSDPDWSRIRDLPDVQRALDDLAAKTAP